MRSYFIYILCPILIILFVIPSCVYRICHPEKTETQLSIDLWSGEIYRWMFNTKD
jgi:hypothetical protein